MSKETKEVKHYPGKSSVGKPEVSLVPTQIIWDITQVREYGNKKYHEPDNWKVVDPQKFVDALLRHTLKFWEDPHAIDPESGLPHYKHMACNLAFICEMFAKQEKEKTE